MKEPVQLVVAPLKATEMRYLLFTSSPVKVPVAVSPLVRKYKVSTHWVPVSVRFQRLMRNCSSEPSVVPLAVTVRVSEAG